MALVTLHGVPLREKTSVGLVANVSVGQDYGMRACFSCFVNFLKSEEGREQIIFSLTVQLPVKPKPFFNQSIASKPAMVRRSWREENPPERHSTSKIKLRDVMPIDFLDGEEDKVPPPAISTARVKPYGARLKTLDEAERIFEMTTNAAYALDRSVPNEILAMADRIWFGIDWPFQAAREAFTHIETDLERWEQQIEAERSQLAQAVLGVRPDDIVASQQNGALTRISADSISLYSTEKRVTFVVSGRRFRKDGTLGKISETMSFVLDRGVGDDE